MKRGLLGVLFLAWMQASVMGADERFSRTLTPPDYAAAGLQKLSPEELARLDALVREFRSGALEAARKEAAVASEASAKAEVKATQPEAMARTTGIPPVPQTPDQPAKKSSGGFLSKVLLPAGTVVEYSTIESRIVGNFSGWEGRTTFQLENGQRWQSESSTSYVTSPLSSPAVKISAGALGAFYMTIEGVKPRVKVRLLTAEK